MGLKEEILNDIADDIIERLKYEIEFDGLEFTGQLKNSWEKHKQEDGSIIIGSRLIWAQITDEGRLPGKAPPMKALIPWVFQKLHPRNEQEMKQKAFLVARKIGEKGIEGRHYVKRALFMLENETG